MDRNETLIPDFASVLSGGEDGSIKTKNIPHIMENQPGIGSGEVVLGDSSEEEMDESDSESESGSESESESELESECEGVSASEFESDSDSDSECEDDASESEDETTTGDEASKTIEVGCDATDDDDGDEDHVYEEGNMDEQEEVCYEDTDLGGEKVDAASLVAASIIAGGGAVRSGSGWTWTSIFVVFAAAGGLGIVLLYAIKRINDLTRLVKVLEENSDMAMNERDVQVITTKVIGDMLEDSEDSAYCNVDTDSVQTEFDDNVESGKQEKNQQTISEILKKDDAKKDDGLFVGKNKDGNEQKEEDVQGNMVAENEKGEEFAVVVIQGGKEESKKQKDVRRADVSEKQSVVNSDSETPPLIPEVAEPEKNDSESDVDNLVVMVRTLSLSDASDLSDDLVEKKEPSRLTRSTKRTRSV